MKEKFIKYLSTSLYEAYFVCLFLPIKFNFGSDIEFYGMNVLFSFLMEEKMAPTFYLSFLLLILPVFGWLVSNKNSKNAVLYYISFSLSFVNCAFFIISKLFGLGQGFGISVCAAMCLILCIVNMIKIFSPEVGTGSKRGSAKSNGAGREITRI